MSSSTKNAIIGFDDIIISPTYNRISKYEIVKVIGIRAEQLQRGAESYVDWDKTKPFDAIKIAQQEYDEHRIPFILQRHAPNKQGDNSYLRLSDEKSTST